MASEENTGGSVGRVSIPGDWRWKATVSMFSMSMFSVTPGPVVVVE